MENTKKIAKNVIEFIGLLIVIILWPIAIIGGHIGGRLLRIVLTPMRILKINPELERDIDNWFRQWGYCPYRVRQVGTVLHTVKVKPEFLEGYWPLDWYKTKKWYVNSEDTFRLHRAQLAYEYKLFYSDFYDFEEFFSRC